LNLEHRVLLDFVLDYRWSLSQLGRISLKVATAHGLAGAGRMVFTRSTTLDLDVEAT
jgi:hypothetical protein